MKESIFQSNLMREIRTRFVGTLVKKEEPTNHQGFPDLLLLFPKQPGEAMGKWAVLEVKRSLNAPHRPNQDRWIDILNTMSFARFICPETMKEVLNELERSLKA